MGYSSNDARVFRTFHDSQLDFDCEFVSAADGTEQICVPRSRVTVVYTDPDCREPAGWLERSDGSSTGDAVSSGPGAPVTSCPGETPAHRDAYRIGELLAEERVPGELGLRLFERSQGGCHTATPPGKVAPPTYRLTPLSESDLARGKRVSLDLGAGLRLARLVADDGAELNLGVTGSDGTACELQRDGECVPEPIARPSQESSGKFLTALNPDCSEPAFEAPYWSNCGDAKYGVQDDGVQAPRVHALKKAVPSFSWQLTIPITDPLTYSCMRVDESALAAPTAPDHEVTGTLPVAGKLRRGAGPLHVDWYSRGETELVPVLADFRRASPGVIPAPEFVDDTGKPCEIRSADDGTERCAVIDGMGQVVGTLTAYPRVIWGRL